MGATEPQRLALHAAARAALGAEEGDTLMALTPPANTDIATMQALERVEERLGARIDLAIGGLRVDIEAAGSRTLRWCVGAIIAAQAVTVGLLTLLLR